MKLTESQLRRIVQQVINEKIEDIRTVFNSLSVSARLNLGRFRNDPDALTIIRNFEKVLKANDLFGYVSWHGGTGGDWSFGSSENGNYIISYSTDAPRTLFPNGRPEIKVNADMTDSEMMQMMQSFISDPGIAKNKAANQRYALSYSDYLARTGDYYG